MRVVVTTVLAVTAFAVGCGTSGAGAVSPETSLTVTVWPNGREGKTRVTWRVTCHPVGGTLPTRGRACRQLDTARRPFAPLRSDLACTQIYGGPQEALVTGRFEGQRIWARFARRDGCEIARWNRVSALFAVVTSAGGGATS